MMRRRRPLMRGAMVAGVGYAGYKAGQSGAQNRAREEEQEARLQELEMQQQYAAPQYAAPAPAAPAPPPAAGMSMDEKVEQLTKLKGLLDAGVLSQTEFDQQKMKILST
jgi:hypothetical protein